MILRTFLPVVFIFTNLVKAKQNREKRTIIGKYPLCPPGCTSCSEFNGCATCEPDMFMLLRRRGARQTGACLRTCPPGYYGVKRKDYNKCNKCRIDKCRSCFSRNHCSDCEHPYLTHKGKCVKACPGSLYYAYHSKTCTNKVDCAVGTWGRWGPCLMKGQSCGYRKGYRTRLRRVLDSPSPNGSRCPAMHETRRCKMRMRVCEDLLHNKSDPSLLQKRKRRRRKKKKRRRKGGRRRYRKRLRVYSHGVQTNDIRAVVIEKS